MCGNESIINREQRFFVYGGEKIEKLWGYLHEASRGGEPLGWVLVMCPWCQRMPKAVIGCQRGPEIANGGSENRIFQAIKLGDTADVEDVGLGKSIRCDVSAMRCDAMRYVYSVQQSINRSITQSINQSITQSLNHSIIHRFISPSKRFPKGFWKRRKGCWNPRFFLLSPSPFTLDL